MRLRRDIRALLPALAALLVAAAVSVIAQPNGIAATCPPGDTSGSCTVLGVTVPVSFPPCPPGASVCPPAVLVIGKDANHPYALQIDIPAPTGPGSGTTSPASHAVAAAAGVDQRWAAESDGHSDRLGDAKAKPKPASIRVGDTVSVQMNRLGVFSFRVTSAAGVQRTSWSNDVKVMRPAGYKRFKTLTKLGWRQDDPNRIHTPGLHKWVR